MLFLVLSYFFNETAAQLIPVFFVAMLLEIGCMRGERPLLERKPFTAYFIGCVASLLAARLANALIRGKIEGGAFEIYGLEFETIRSNIAIYLKYVFHDYGLLLLLLVAVFIIRVSFRLLKRKGFDRVFQWQVVFLLQLWLPVEPRLHIIERYGFLPLLCFGVGRFLPWLCGG